MWVLLNSGITFLRSDNFSGDYCELYKQIKPDKLHLINKDTLVVTYYSLDLREL